MSTSSVVVLSIMNWLHMVATLIWFGGMITNVIFILPTAEAVLGRTLGPAVFGTFMGAFAKRVRIPVYVSMGVLIVTGAIMWILNENSLGAFTYGSAWTNVLLVKQILFIILIVLAIYMMEVIIPKIEDLAPRGPSPELEKVQKLQIVVGAISMLMMALILAFSAWLGAISGLK